MIEDHITLTDLEYNFGLIKEDVEKLFKEVNEGILPEDKILEGLGEILVALEEQIQEIKSMRRI